VQHGPSKIRPHGARSVDYLPFEDFDSLVAAVRVVVTHAGIGSVAAALAHGRRPVVVPRLRRFGEAVDDHQSSFARRLEDARLVTVVEDLDRLPEVVAASDHSAQPTGGPDLSVEIRTVLDDLLDGESAVSRRGRLSRRFRPT
jgi:UDP-N-acetylglucosamine transferase subunit ALG13